jgi:hypothetical protein
MGYKFRFIVLVKFLTPKTFKTVHKFLLHIIDRKRF